MKLYNTKGNKKIFFVANNIPTSPHKRFSNKAALLSYVDNNTVALPFVWKSAQFGYDGTGVKVVRTQNDIQNLADTDCIIEDLIPFKKRISSYCC